MPVDAFKGRIPTKRIDWSSLFDDAIHYSRVTLTTLAGSKGQSTGWTRLKWTLWDCVDGGLVQNKESQEITRLLWFTPRFFFISQYIIKSKMMTRLDCFVFRTWLKKKIGCRFPRLKLQLNSKQNFIIQTPQTSSKFIINSRLFNPWLTFDLVLSSILILVSERERVFRRGKWIV